MDHLELVDLRSWTQHYAYAPKPKGRPRRGRNGAMYTPKSTREFEARTNHWWQGPLFDEGIPLGVVITLNRYNFDVTVAEIPEGEFKLRGDIDNYAKSIMDALHFDKESGLGAYHNDAQVKQLHVRVS